MLPSPNELEYFLELSQSLNFSRASERLGITQPTLSAAIKKLEQKVESPLFIRHKTGLVLTPAAKHLQEHVENLLHLWNTTKNKALSSETTAAGIVSIGCHSSVGLITAPKFLPDIIKDSPALEIKFNHDLSRKIMEKVISYKLDIGIVVNPTPHPDIVIIPLYKNQIEIWHKAGYKEAINMKNIDNSTIFCDPNLIQTRHIIKKLQRNNIFPKRYIHTSNLELIADLTAQGLGFGIMPTAVAYGTKILLAPVKNSPIYLDRICLIFRHENRNIFAVRTVIKAIKDNCKGLY